MIDRVVQRNCQIKAPRKYFRIRLVVYISLVHLAQL